MTSFHNSSRKGLAASTFFSMESTGKGSTGHYLPDGTGLGAILSALVGYTSKPSLMQLLAYVGYLVGVGAAATYLSRPAQTPTAQTHLAQAR